MSSPAAWIRWDARCRNMPAHGVTAGDTYYLGLRDYVEMYPCPNGLPIDHRHPAEVPAWSDRIAKAKRDIEQHKSEQRVKLLAESISVDEVKKGIEVLKAWANSLRLI
jgi:hypothetical protein